MDGIHDLGGRQGFGKIDVDEPEEAFHSGWEARAFAIVRSMSRAPDWTLDKFRFTREQIDPVDYLTRPYYDQWIQCYAALMIGSSLAGVEELASGKSRSGIAGLGPPRGPQSVAVEKRKASPFDRPYDNEFAFAAGDHVVANRHARGGHTRLPAYVRGQGGVIAHVRGAFVFPDDSARGIERAEPLYTVTFKATDLWPDEGCTHLVNLDLWESYLDPA